MNIKTLKIDDSYIGKGEKILHEFLIPVISRSVNYDRITSFYNVDSLIAVSQGLQNLINNNGKMRLIIGIHSFPIELVDASLQQEYLAAEIEKIREEITTGIKTLTDSLKKEQLATMSWMIHDKLLEVKAASIKGRGLFHPKTLILKDSEGNEVAAVGSSNETAQGLGDNYEQIVVLKSWESQNGVQKQKEFFDFLWKGGNQEVLVQEISQETAELIFQALGPEYSNRRPSNFEILNNSAQMLSNFFVSGDVPALFMHQERAVIDALSRWPVRVLFSDEVGLGKTFEVAATMIFLTKYCNIKRVLILTPKSVLKQWQDELYLNFSINAWLFDSNTQEYVDYFGKHKPLLSSCPIGKEAPNLLLMSAQFARGNKKNGSIFDYENALLPELLILDEAHSARVTRDLSGKQKKTLMYNVLERVSRKIPHLIFATATPMQKEAEEYHALLKLLGLPKEWSNVNNYLSSLQIISNNELELSNAHRAGKLLKNTIAEMHPNLEILNEQEITALAKVLDSDESNKFEFGSIVSQNWNVLYSVFIKLHPANLLTVRNTRRSLEKVGYLFPKRNLNEVSIEDSVDIQFFYQRVEEYLEQNCFSIENILYPDRIKSIGLVKIGYQQRLASSLHSCNESLKRRFSKIEELEKWLVNNNITKLNRETIFSLNTEPEDWDFESFLNEDNDTEENNPELKLKELKRAIGIEQTSLAELINKSDKLIKDRRDLKIIHAIKLAKQCMSDNDQVLVFSRYTDTVDAILQEYCQQGLPRIQDYAVYTGAESFIVKNNKKTDCDKNTIKSELFSKSISIVFCSDAASEGLNLQSARVLINVDVPWTPARLEQRIGRVARLGQTAKEVEVYNIWYPHSVEAKMYSRINSRLRNTNIAVGDFPEIIASGILSSILKGTPNDDSSIDELRAIRNNAQVKALEKLWDYDNERVTTSNITRKRLLKICCACFEEINKSPNSKIHTFILPDGSHTKFSEESGLEDSISYKSLSKMISKYLDDITVCFGQNKKPLMFKYKCQDIKHEAVLKLILGEALNENDLLKKYPSMLPNPQNLSFAYATDCNVENRPYFWK